MKQAEYLGVVVMEECCELAHRVSKGLRFGWQEVQPDHPDQDTNRERALIEYAQLVATLEMLGLPIAEVLTRQAGVMSAKAAKVEKYMAYSRECGTLHD